MIRLDVGSASYFANGLYMEAHTEEAALTVRTWDARRDHVMALRVFGGDGVEVTVHGEPFTTLPAVVLDDEPCARRCPICGARCELPDGHAAAMHTDNGHGWL